MPIDVDDLAIHQLEVGATLKSRLSQPVEQPVEQVRAESAGQCFPAAVDFASVDDLVRASAPQLEHLWHQLRRMLQVTIHEHDRVAAYCIETGADGALLTKIPGQR